MHANKIINDYNTYHYLWYTADTNYDKFNVLSLKKFERKIRNDFKIQLKVILRIFVINRIYFYAITINCQGITIDCHEITDDIMI